MLARKCEARQARLAPAPERHREFEFDEKKGPLTGLIGSIADSNMKRLTRDHRHYTFSASHPPALHVAQDETFIVETTDCFNGAVTPANPSAEVAYEKLNPITGPIFVEGAKVGDMLAVTIHHIETDNIGVARFGSASGQLARHIDPSCTCCTRFFDVDKEKKMLTMRDVEKSRRIAPISFPASPMLGVIGVAPQGDATTHVPTMPAGKHGGNLDDRMNGIGSTIYLRVNHPGALLSLGDMHASQGDGEICGCGVEISGEVQMSCRVLKMSKLVEFPVTETESHWHTHGVTVEDIPGATTVACEEAARLLVDQWGFTMEDAFVFLSVKGNLGLCQACHPDKGTQILRMSVPKIDACPRPFRCLHEGTS